MKVDKYVTGAVRQFAYWFAHGTIGGDLLSDIDYLSDLREERQKNKHEYCIQ